jgi:hypothetical protein
VDVRTPVPVIKTVKVKFYNCKTTVFGPILGAGNLALLQKTTKERFAQCGIKIDWVDANGVSLGTISASLSDYPTWSGPGNTMQFPQQSRDFFSNPLMPFAADEIPVYAVGCIGIAPKDHPGWSTVPSLMGRTDIAAKLDNKCLLGRDWHDFTVAHELLHVLLNTYHEDIGDPQEGPYHTEFDNTKMLWRSTVNDATISDSKRISARQADAILGTSSMDPASPFPK